MDPLTHTMVGGCLARTSLGRKTRLAAPALILGANLPDVDVLSYIAGSDAALGFRRGWTHGVLALVVLPVLLGLGLWLLGRARRPGRRGRPDERPLSLRWLLLLSTLAIVSHPTLDWLNNYGMRWWMPFDGTWYYGDAVFIVDPWLWLLLAASWLALRWTRRLGAALLACGTLYVLLLIGLQGATERRVLAELAEAPSEWMVGPILADPLAWSVVVGDGAEYRYGRFDWRTGELSFSSERLVAARETPTWAELDDSRQIPGFLRWTRFPWLERHPPAAGETIYVMDARYARRRTTGFGGAEVTR